MKNIFYVLCFLALLIFLAGFIVFLYTTYFMQFDININEVLVKNHDVSYTDISNYDITEEVLYDEQKNIKEVEIECSMVNSLKIVDIYDVILLFDRSDLLPEFVVGKSLTLNCHGR